MVHFWLAGLFYDGRIFDHAQAHVERARSHTANSTINLAYVMKMQANIWYAQHRFEEARSEALRAIDVYEKVGATECVERCRTLLRYIQEFEELDTAVESDQSNPNCEPMQMMLFSACIDSLLSTQDWESE